MRQHTFEAKDGTKMFVKVGNLACRILEGAEPLYNPAWETWI